MENRILHWILFCLFITLLQSCSETIEGSLIITNVNVIDVKTGDLQTRRDVAILGEEIITITTHKKNTTYVTEHLVDGTDMYLTPGLWDMHTHTWWAYDEYSPLLLAKGITNVREMFGHLESVNEIKRQLRAGEIIGPDLVSPGPIVDGDPPSWDGSDVAETPEKGREIVRQQKVGGAEFIKVYDNLEKEVYFAIADECEKLAIPMNGHIPEKITLEEALNVGHRSIEHFYGITEFCSSNFEYTMSLNLGEITNDTLSGPGSWYKITEFLLEGYDASREKRMVELMKKHNAWVCPTLTVHLGFIRSNDPNYPYDLRRDYMPQYTMNNWPVATKEMTPQLEHKLSIERKWYDQIVRLLTLLNEEGINILAGSDYPNPGTYAGFSLHEELQLFVEEAGFSPHEALQTATINPAIFLGLENEMGSVEMGKLASLVLLDENPLIDIKNTTTINAVILRGRYLDGKELNDKIERVAEVNRLPKIKDVLSKSIIENGFAQALSEYHSLRSSQSDKYNFNEDQLNTLGYELMGAGKIKEAIQLFELNVKVFPDYGNGYDSLGDGYLAISDTTNAIKAYETAVAKGTNLSLTKIEALKK